MLYQLSYLGLLSGDEADPKPGPYRWGTGRWQGSEQRGQKPSLMAFILVIEYWLYGIVGFIVRDGTWDRIGIREPLAEINIGAALGAKRYEVCRGLCLADWTALGLRYVCSQNHFCCH